MSVSSGPPPVPVAVFLDEDEERLAEYCYKAATTTTTTTTTTTSTAEGSTTGMVDAVATLIPSTTRQRSVQFSHDHHHLSTARTHDDGGGDPDAVNAAPVADTHLDHRERDHLFGGFSTTIVGDHDDHDDDDHDGRGCNTGSEAVDNVSTKEGRLLSSAATSTSSFPSYCISRVTKVSTAASNPPPTIAVGDVVRHVEKNCRGVVRYIGPMYQVTFDVDDDVEGARRQQQTSFTAHEAAEWLVWKYAQGKKEQRRSLQQVDGGDGDPSSTAGISVAPPTTATPPESDQVEWDAYCADMTNRYKGITFTVPDIHGVWFGVQWEKAVGKGDGCVQGVEYFPGQIHNTIGRSSAWPEDSVRCEGGFGSILKRNKIRTQKSLLRALFQRFTTGSEGATPEAILRPCANVYYREDVSPSRNTAAALQNDEVPVGGSGQQSVGGGTTQHKGYCRRTHGLDPFVRNDLTGQFTNVLLTDCSANESLQSVGFGNEKFVSVQYTKFILRAARVANGQAPPSPSSSPATNVHHRPHTEVMIDVNLNVVTPSCILDGTEAGEEEHCIVNNTSGPGVVAQGRKYAHHPPHTLIQQRDITNAAFLKECFLRAIVGGGGGGGGSPSGTTNTTCTSTTTVRSSSEWGLGGQSERGAAGAVYSSHSHSESSSFTNTIILSRSRRKLVNNNDDTITTTDQEECREGYEIEGRDNNNTATTSAGHRALATVSSTASMTVASPVTPFGTVTGDNALAPFIETMGGGGGGRGEIMETSSTAGETTTITSNNGTNPTVAPHRPRGQKPTRDHHQHKLTFNQEMTSSPTDLDGSTKFSSPLVTTSASGSGYFSPSSSPPRRHQQHQHVDPSVGFATSTTNKRNNSNNDYHNVLLEAASMVDKSLSAVSADVEVKNTIVGLPSPSAFERCFSLHYLFPNLNTLSVSNTLLQSWTDLLDIIVSFPVLRVLNASSNPLRPFTTQELLHLYEVYGMSAKEATEGGEEEHHQHGVSPNGKSRLESAQRRLTAKPSDRFLPRLTSLVVSDTGLTAEMFVFLLSVFPSLNVYSVGYNAPESSQGAFSRLATGSTQFKPEQANVPFPNKSFLHPGNMANGINNLLAAAARSTSSTSKSVNIIPHMLKAASDTLCYSVQILSVAGMDFTVDDGDSDTTGAYPPQDVGQHRPRSSSSSEEERLRKQIRVLFTGSSQGSIGPSPTSSEAAYASTTAVPSTPGTSLQPLLMSLCMIDERFATNVTTAPPSSSPSSFTIPVAIGCIPPTATSTPQPNYDPVVVICPCRPSLTRLQVTDCPIRSLGYASQHAVDGAKTLLSSGGCSGHNDVNDIGLPPSQLPTNGHLFDTVEAILAKGCLFRNWDEAFLCLHNGGDIQGRGNNNNNNISALHLDEGGGDEDFLLLRPPSSSSSSATFITEGTLLESRRLVRRRCFPRVNDIILTDCPAVEACGSDTGAQRRHQVCCFPPPPAQGVVAFSSTLANSNTSATVPPSSTTTAASTDTQSPVSLSGSCLLAAASVINAPHPSTTNPIINLPSSPSTAAAAPPPRILTLDVSYMDKLNKSIITKVERSGSERHVIKVHGEWYYGHTYPVVKGVMLELCVVLLREVVSCQNCKDICSNTSANIKSLIDKARGNIGSSSAHYWNGMQEIDALLHALQLPATTSAREEVDQEQQQQQRQRVLRSLAIKINLFVKGFLLDKGSCFSDFINASGATASSSTTSFYLPQHVSIKALFVKYIENSGSSSHIVNTGNNNNTVSSSSSISTLPNDLWNEALRAGGVGGGIGGVPASPDAVKRKGDAEHNNSPDKEEDEGGDDGSSISSDEEDGKQTTINHNNDNNNQTPNKGLNDTDGSNGQRGGGGASSPSVSPSRNIGKDNTRISIKPRCAVVVASIVSPLCLLEEATLMHPISTTSSSSSLPSPPPPPCCWLPQLRRLALDAMSEVYNDLCAVADGSVSLGDLIEDEIATSSGKGGNANHFRRLGGRVGPSVVQAPPKKRPVGPLLAINDVDVEFTTALLTPSELLIARACCFHDTIHQHLSVSKAKRRQRKAKLREALEGGTLVPKKEPKLTPAMLQQMNGDEGGGGGKSSSMRMPTVRSSAVLSSTDDGDSTSVGTSTTIASAIAAGLVDPLSSRRLDPMFEATIDVRWTSKQLQSHLCEQAHLPNVSPYSKENLAAANGLPPPSGPSPTPTIPSANDLNICNTPSPTVASPTPPLASSSSSSSVVPKQYLHDDVIDEEDHWSVASLTLYAYLDRTRRILKTNTSDATTDATGGGRKSGGGFLSSQGTFNATGMLSNNDDDDMILRTASAAKEVIREFPMRSTNPAGRQFPPAEFMFPKGSVFMFHVSRELLKNEGAVAKGMHCADMVRGGDKIHKFRVAPRDVFVLVLIV